MIVRVRYFRGLPLYICLLIGSCISGREFWSYVVDREIEKPMAKREVGERDTERAISPHNVRVAYSDGTTSTEVLIPILTSGQQIVVDHKGKPSAASLEVVPLPPTEADKALEDSYLKSGQPVAKKAPPVSIVKTHEKIRNLLREGSYSIALQYAEQLLKRYPNHAETLRIKGSLLLKMGERAAALKAYQRAQEIEPDRQVEEQIKQLEEVMGD